MNRMTWIASMALVAVVAGAALAQEAGKPVNPLTDTSVYPIAVWAMDAKTAPAFAEMGVNIFVGEQGDPKKWCDALAESGCVGFVHWSSKRDEAARKAIAESPGFLGWMHGDEPDNPGVVNGDYRPTRIPPAEPIAAYKAMKASSTPAPMYLNLGQGLAVATNQSTPDDVYREFMKSADVVCYDVYPTSTQPQGTHRLHLVARGIQHLKELAGPDKPAWIWLECTSIHGETPGIGFRPPHAFELRAEIWMSILYGADGIGYFPHAFSPYKSGPAAIPDELKKEMKLTDHLLQKLAPVLRTGKKNMLEVTSAKGRVDAASWTLGQDVLLVAVNMWDAPAEATIPVGAAVKEFTVVGQNEKAKVADGALSVTMKPYEVRLFWTGSQLTNQSYRYPELPPTKELPDNVAFDFEGDLPAGMVLKGEARISEDMAHGGKKSLYVGEMGDAIIPLTDEDFGGKVTMWVYDSSKKHAKEDPNTPAVGTCWGLVDSSGRMMLYGILRRSFLSQSSYSFAFTNQARSIPSPGYASLDRTKPGWYKWEFDLSAPGQIKALVNGKAAADVSKNYASFDKGFNAIRIIGGAKGEFEDIYIDDIQVEYPRKEPEKPGNLADLPFQRDLRKGVRWSRTQNTVLACVPLSEAPVIDGKGGDPAWKDAESIGTFTKVDGKDEATFQTGGAIGRHDGKLYMIFVCLEDFLDELVTDKAALWQDDCLEFFIDPSGRRASFAHIIVSSDGRVSATRTVPDAWGEGQRDDAWAPHIEVKAGRADRAWTVEMAIDLKDLGDTEANPLWAFDVARERKPRPAENSVWTIGGFNDAFSFGALAFNVADDPVTLANGKLRNRTDVPRKALVQVTISEPEYGVLFPTWEDRWRDVVKEVIAYDLAPMSQARGGETILQRDIMQKVPDGGRVRFTLLNEHLEPHLWEEFIANAFGGIKQDK